MAILKVFIANFGRENYAWPQCLERSTVATMNAEEVQGFWLTNDREAYINYCIRHIKTAKGIASTRPIASRWFNLMTVVAETSGDLWIHREKGQLWWTISKPDRPAFERFVEPINDDRRVVICHKACEPWSNASKSGHRLDWDSLHAKAREFLFTEGTLQQLSNDNALYAIALIEGRDVVPWHSLPLWKAKAEKARNNTVTVFNARQRAAARMAMTAADTVAHSNGQQILRTQKNKELRFTLYELELYITDLIEAQDGLCALSGLALQYDGECDNAELLCSLDRIDSDGHYEAGNLQVVCKFINRWKNSSDDATFRRLIDLVRAQ